MKEDEQKVALIHLEELAALQMDSFKGLQDMSQNISLTGLTEYFKKEASVSYEMVTELNEEIILLNGEIKTKGTLKGAINHLWMNIKQNVGAGDVSDLMKNVIYCEEFNLERYQKVLNERLPKRYTLIFNKHLKRISSRLEELKEMKFRFSLADNKKQTHSPRKTVTERTQKKRKA